MNASCSFRLFSFKDNVQVLSTYILLIYKNVFQHQAA